MEECRGGIIGKVYTFTEDGMKTLKKIFSNPENQIEGILLHRYYRYSDKDSENSGKEFIVHNYNKSTAIFETSLDEIEFEEMIRLIENGSIEKRAPNLEEYNELKSRWEVKEKLYIKQILELLFVYEEEIGFWKRHRLLRHLFRRD